MMVKFDRLMALVCMCPQCSVQHARQLIRGTHAAVFTLNAIYSHAHKHFEFEVLMGMGSALCHMSRFWCSLQW